jgi:hypothetical protein
VEQVEEFLRQRAVQRFVGCMEAGRQRTPEVGVKMSTELCVNAHNSKVPDCGYYAEDGEHFCYRCQMRNKDMHDNTLEASWLENRPKIRTIPASARPCILQKGCMGRMEANLRSFKAKTGERLELWWSCPMCHNSMNLLPSKAVRDERIKADGKPMTDEELAEKISESMYD